MSNNQNLAQPPAPAGDNGVGAAAAPPPAPDAIVAVDPRLLVREQGLAGYLTEFRRRMRSGDLGSLPVIVALVVIWGVFQGLNSGFLSANNLSTIAFNVVGTGMIAVGIVFVLLLGEIDLSVSYVSGLAGAVFAVLSVQHGVPEGLALVLGLLTGAAIGALQGFFFAKVGVPAFVVTLAGFLAWNGAMLWALGKTGTINLPSGGLLYTLYNYTFSDVAAAYGVALLGVLLYLGASLWEANRRRRAGVPFRPLLDIVLKTVLLAVVAFGAAVVLNQADGLPLCLLIFLVVVVGLDLVLRRTTYGRRIFAVGGGIEAARRAGINVAWIRISVFMISGTMAAVGGMFLAGQVNSAQSTQGGGNTLMNAIAAAVIGGTSLFGGRGKTWSALLGALVIVSIQQGMYILNLGTAIQYMITGAVLLAAVVVDSVSRRTQKASGRA
ncbi:MULTISPECIES: sugar ABC transporter permease [Streptomycetaceae]|uniref:Xylose transport system permease protein XylH n=1 Tax=Streptantibioticus cattleyicolor (strain ATCC 35852 / DSM 46488 / JCM 4925 / NBRC 14057 / NRRL 8057) TaxID=1003195 RepID=F8JWP3_STREN|nr:ABC transporter permease [Streptantibioticus cattleyicolor]AEW97040.1 ABC transporter permease protein [Streptantibioticus cattleyicolor NRRL 8057 = DSM 46488]MYS61506.1 sugar ABC transporter permease [Streptomyces sp. SID5468]CCB77366.1 putative simple sugar ABC transporter permease protein [Streptantibioticus cattleyicolor NRRL 8057 = DSM 46488]